MLDISITDGESGPVLALSGEVDFTTASSAAAAVERCLRDRPQQVTVDLRSVTFCDCAGGRLLQDAQRQATAAGAGFRLTGLTPPTRRVLTLMRATGLLAAAGEPAGPDEPEADATDGGAADAGAAGTPPTLRAAEALEQCAAWYEQLASADHTRMDRYRQEAALCWEAAQEYRQEYRTGSAG